ncbi:hypothetical protein, partial [Escherichia coli]|uniref:hypothetical protein n=1 Tax=Escherichia coli TaxID=562 RepID=UPI001EDB9F13
MRETKIDIRLRPEQIAVDTARPHAQRVEAALGQFLVDGLRRDKAGLGGIVEPAQKAVGPGQRNGQALAQICLLYTSPR